MLTGVAFALIVCFSLGPQVSIFSAGHHQQEILWLPGRRPWPSYSDLDPRRPVEHLRPVSTFGEVCGENGGMWVRGADLSVGVRQTAGSRFLSRGDPDSLPQQLGGHRQGVWGTVPTHPVGDLSSVVWDGGVRGVGVLHDLCDLSVWRLSRGHGQSGRSHKAGEYRDGDYRDGRQRWRPGSVRRRDISGRDPNGRGHGWNIASLKVIYSVHLCLTP